MLPQCDGQGFLPSAVQPEVLFMLLGGVQDRQLTTLLGHNGVKHWWRLGQ